MQVESTNGCAIELQDFGGSGPNLIISHATGFHGGVYKPMARTLLDHFHVWAVDFRGHGASPAPANNDFGWEGMGQDLMACLDHISAVSSGDIYGFGHSLGGAATLLAEQARPGSFAGIYVFEPIVFDQAYIIARTDNPMSAAARRRREIFPSRAEALARYAARPPLGMLRADVLWAYVERGFDDLDDGTVRLACRRDHEALSFEAEDKMTLDRLAGLATPVTVALGQVAPQGFGPAVLAPAVAEAVENGTLVEHQFLSHFGPLEAPDVIAADVLAAFV